MLMEQLGFRPPRADEEARILAGETAIGAVHAAALQLPAAVLHADPLISYSGSVPKAPLGLASIAPASMPPGWFLISPTWSIDPAQAAELRAAAVRHRRARPHDKLVFICNETREVELLQDIGEAAFAYNKAANTSEAIFKPLDQAAVDFDAIYNAQLVPWKRHELCLAIERCGFLFYRDRSDPQAATHEAVIMARHTAEAPRHVFINPLDRQGVPIRLSPSKVNLHVNRASVGLCLSAIEGAMFASLEYLLAGLPVVSTPSIGGRDVFYDDGYCHIVEPDARAVVEAVRALQARGIPRAHVRERTLRRVTRERERFLGLMDAILAGTGSAMRFGNAWPFRRAVTMEWMAAGQAIARAAGGIVDGFEREKRGFLSWRRWRRRIFPQHSAARC